MDNLKITVVMATYNGAKYLREQLESIKNQSREPDEVLIFDDCSNDGGRTVEIVKSYIERNGLSSWSLIENPYNLGWKKNFINGVKKANGDLIFLSDQDDVWSSNKIKRMVSIMESNSQINLLCSNYSILNERKRNVKSQCLCENDKLEQIKLTAKFHLVNRPGCTYCLRKDFALKAITCWVDDFAHDSLFWIAAAITNSLFCINTSLIRFRRHDCNASGNGHVKDKGLRRRLQKKELDVFRKLKDTFLLNASFSKKRKKILEEYECWAEKRINYLENKSFRVFLIVLRHVKYYSSWKSLLADSLE
ncbi:MAG: glycosyltransferase [Candidatus Saccharibacteria bacterium]|nr:glycosyltransferase [Candidatus Saccharibacteria bacterium]